MPSSTRGRRPARVVACLPFLVSVLAGACQAQRPEAPVGGTASRWEGTRYPPAPEGVVIERGTTLGPADTASFALAEVVTDTGRLIWLGKRADGAGDGSLWSVVDVLELPALGDGRWLMLAICGSLAPGAPPEPEEVRLDPAVIAIARAGEDAVLADLERAWRASPATGEIEPIPPTGLVCLNDVEPEP